MKEEIEWFKPNSYAIDYQRNYTNDGDYTSVDYTKNLLDSMNTMFKYIYTSTASGISRRLRPTCGRESIEEHKHV